MQYKDMLQLMMDATGEEDEELEEAMPTNEHKDAEKCLNEALAAADPPPPPPSLPCKKGGVSKLTDEQIVAEAVGLMMAGYDTSANALAYTSYLLALHPEIQERLQSEIDDYFNDKPVSYSLIACISRLHTNIIMINIHIGCFHV